VDAGLRERFRAAAAQISWTEVGPKRPRAPAKPGPGGKAAGPSERVRKAHLNDEEARIEVRRQPGRLSIRVDSGPLGALLLLLELDQLGPPGALSAHEAEAGGPFPAGSIEAVWADGPVISEDPIPLDDVVRLARYALA
jgi:hypothetical protein